MLCHTHSTFKTTAFHGLAISKGFKQEIYASVAYWPAFKGLHMRGWTCHLHMLQPDQVECRAADQEMSAATIRSLLFSKAISGALLSFHGHCEHSAYRQDCDITQCTPL